MLDQVEAIRFIREMSSGRNKPWLVEVERTDGTVDEVVAKLSSSECGIPGLIREAFASMLAADLGLPLPEPVLVNFPELFLNTLASNDFDARNRIESSVNPAFGSVYKSSLHAISSASNLPLELLANAAEIIAFDGICLNVDRRPSKPNCLTNEKDILFMIDHELAFTDIDILGSYISPNPWDIGGMSHMASDGSNHVLLRFVKGKGLSIARLEAEWKKITPQRIVMYADALPPAWKSVSTDGQIVAYLIEVLDNLDSAFLEAKRVIS